ncbi:MAG: galactokinase [Steroidobacteraceae bacterium]|jgi:galactokinase|nr:galactokinase [Steroidobacteraceae bacterium]
MASFQAIYGTAPAVSATAPGRVNLLGEHTDYNQGYVLPTAIPQRTRVELARSPDGRFAYYSANLDARIDHVDGRALPVDFARYLHGCVEVLREDGHAVPPLRVRVESDVPIGAGLSSSAALEVATLRAIRELLSLPVDDVQLALLAQRAEVKYAGVRCGVLDQMASSLCDREHMLFLDTLTLERRVLPLPRDAELIVLDSGMPRDLADSAYNTRRAECEAAAQHLGVPSLRHVADPARTRDLPRPLDRRARHVVTENNRVLEAVTADAARFGQLMNDSHASLRDDYEVSVPALDALVGALQAQPGVLGARLTGAGFGGACVALARRGTADAARPAALAIYARGGWSGRVLV